MRRQKQLIKAFRALGEKFSPKKGYNKRSVKKAKHSIKVKVNFAHLCLIRGIA